MHIHPDVAGLRHGLPAQPLTDAALARWRARGEVAAVLAALPVFDAGAALEEVPVLARLLSDAGTAARLAGGLIEALAPALAAEPLAQLPLGHTTAPGMARLRLASHGRSALTLAAYACRTEARPVSALFEDGLGHEVVIAGEGIALVHRREGARLESTTVALTPGTRLTRGGVEDARQIIAVTRPVLMLQLTREPAHPHPACEIALADGSLVRTISGCRHTSQQMMALAVLGTLGHERAVPVMAALARDRSAERDLRWEALRHCLALDAWAGLAALTELADDPADGLADPARALKTRLSPLLAEAA